MPAFKDKSARPLAHEERKKLHLRSIAQFGIRAQSEVSCGEDHLVH